MIKSLESKDIPSSTKMDRDPQAQVEKWAGESREPSVIDFSIEDGHLTC